MTGEAAELDRDFRFSRAFYLYAAFFPLIWAAGALLTGNLREPVLSTAVAFCVTADYLLLYRAYRRLTRYASALRLDGERRFTPYQALGGVLFGGLLAALWDEIPAAHGKEFWIALAIGALSLTSGPFYKARVHSVVWLHTVASRLLFDKGIFLFYAATSHSSPGLLRLAGWIALLELPSFLYMTRDSKSPSWLARTDDAHNYLQLDRDARRLLYEDVWLADSVRPKRGRKAPDLTFVHTLAHEAVSSVQQARQLVLDLDGLSASAARPGMKSLEWAEAAAALVDLAESEVDTGRAAVRRRLRLARAHCAHARSAIYLATGHRDEFRAAFAEARALWTAEGLHDLAAEESVTVLQNSGVDHTFQLLTVADGLDLVGPLVGSADLRSFARRQVLFTAAVLHEDEGDRARAERLRAAGLAVPRRARDRWRLARQYRSAGLRRRASELALLDRMVAINSGPLRAASRFAPVDAPGITVAGWPASRARDLTLRALRQWALGRKDKAEELLLQAAELLRASDQLHTAFDVLLELGRAQIRTHPAGAFRNLSAAAEIYETLRDRILDDELRMQSGGPIERLLVMLVGLLLTEAPRGTGPGWPAAPGAAAFDLVERARSRSLLELLGTTVPPAGAVPPDLLADEARARAEVAARRAPRPAGDGEEDALRALRDALRSLAAAQERIAAAAVPGEEYISLSRGTPLTFTEVRALLRPEATA
ncbi:hypothetical protein [Actinomadura chibensis]|uniref:Uncharacterized protein n=1 Tax=Actinomadura chibensis TaxID=392828 RepID=A0A5D0NND7_9ACTN|nr:hypothetical protein [Actinomadura chibensis]TYB45521.1 hypothetical protein FXF69_19005 [Actinomadura chibensis]